MSLNKVPIITAIMPYLISRILLIKTAEGNLAPHFS